MKNTEWLIVDTETDGLMDPIHVVEIAAQRMKGWEPVGEKFRVLLNHNVPIPQAAVAIHGYTEEFLRKHGEDPLKAHASFRDFAGGLPMVAHNLSFDWNRALGPEWERLGLAPAGQRGFCSLMLSRRVVDETKSYSLDALRRTFGLPGDFAHRAFGDVETMVALFDGVFRPRLEEAGIGTFTGVLEFARKTPVAKCLCAVRCKTADAEQPRPATVVDSWYFIDAQNQTHGPLPAREIVGCMRGQPCWVWRDGLADWTSSEKSEEFLRALRTQPESSVRRKPRRKRAAACAMAELLGLCQGIIADGVVTAEEVVLLSRWLEQAGVLGEWPATEIAETVERIMADGIVTDDERAELQRLLQRVDSGDKGRKKEVGEADPKRTVARTNTESSPEERVAGLEIKMACSCGQRVSVDSAAGGQEFSCPACGAAMRVPSVEENVTAAPMAELQSQAPGRDCAKLELTCVGNAGGGYINAQIQVLWFETFVDEARKRVDVVEHDLPMKNHRRENRVNICEYEVPGDVVCFYERRVQIKPNTQESCFFKFVNGEFQVLGQGAKSDFPARFLKEYSGYDICTGSSREAVEESRQLRAEVDRRGPGIYVISGRRRDSCIEERETTMLASGPASRLNRVESPQTQSGDFTTVQLDQGTPEWLEWRNQGIGASDAPAIMGENPWKTAADLLREKRRPARQAEPNAAMARGTALEPEARKAYMSRTGKWVQAACLQSTRYEWLRASVDGITPSLDAVVEIKCGDSVYAKTAASGCAPDYYYGQLQHILAVTGLPAIDFWCYLPGRPELLVPVKRDDKYIDRLLEAEFQFWAQVERNR